MLYLFVLFFSSLTGDRSGGKTIPSHLFCLFEKFKSLDMVGLHKKDTKNRREGIREICYTRVVACYSV